VGFYEDGNVIFGLKNVGKFFVHLSGLTRTASVGRVHAVAWEKAAPRWTRFCLGIETLLLLAESGLNRMGQKWSWPFSGNVRY
jgi:hypothetical protein